MISDVNITTKKVNEKKALEMLPIARFLLTNDLFLDMEKVDRGHFPKINLTFPE